VRGGRAEAAAPARETLLFETDWLASRPVFYNEKTGAASHNANDVIDFAEVELDPEGLNAYLGTGYSIFGRTPVRDVRLLPCSARLWRRPDGTLRIEEAPLDLARMLERRLSEDDVIELLQQRVRAAERAPRDGELVIPTSGGLDSRLLNLLVADPSQVRSFTFGPTQRQWDSVEVARACELARMLGSRWERVPIGRFHELLPQWDEAFGPAIHAHGMYQLEFFTQVAARVGAGSLVLSGLFGDRFEGRADAYIPEVDSPRGVAGLVRTYGQHIRLSMSRVPWTGALAEEYYETHREALATHVGRVIENVRFRMVLLHYLLRVPELCGLRVDAPFLDVDVATAMLTLPRERRLERRWVTDYIKRRSASLRHVEGNQAYRLYWAAMRRRPLQPLDERLLREIVRPEYVRWINRLVSWRGLWCEGYEHLQWTPGFRRLHAALRGRGLDQRRLEAYHAYMTLWPLQQLLQRRDVAHRDARGADELRLESASFPVPEDGRGVRRSR
jgi:asparagine synthetase B (glutamine-hydrolysing)